MLDIWLNFNDLQPIYAYKRYAYKTKSVVNNLFSFGSPCGPFWFGKYLEFAQKLLIWRNCFIY